MEAIQVIFQIVISSSAPHYKHIVVKGFIIITTYRSTLQSDSMCPPPPQRVHVICDVSVGASYSAEPAKPVFHLYVTLDVSMYQ